MLENDVTMCPACGGEMEPGTINGSPFLMWAKGDERAGRFGTTIGAERLGRGSPTRSSRVDALRCPTCRTGSFRY